MTDPDNVYTPENDISICHTDKGEPCQNEWSIIPTSPLDSSEIESAYAKFKHQNVENSFNERSGLIDFRNTLGSNRNNVYHRDMTLYEVQNQSDSRFTYIGKFGGGQCRCPDGREYEVGALIWDESDVNFLQDPNSFLKSCKNGIMNFENVSMVTELEGTETWDKNAHFDKQKYKGRAVECDVNSDEKTVMWNGIKLGGWGCEASSQYMDKWFISLKKKGLFSVYVKIFA